MSRTTKIQLEMVNDIYELKYLLKTHLDDATESIAKAIIDKQPNNTRLKLAAKKYLEKNNYGIRFPDLLPIIRVRTTGDVTDGYMFFIMEDGMCEPTFLTLYENGRVETEYDVFYHKGDFNLKIPAHEWVLEEPQLGKLIRGMYKSLAEKIFEFKNFLHNTREGYQTCLVLLVYLNNIIQNDNFKVFEDEITWGDLKERLSGGTEFDEELLWIFINLLYIQKVIVAEDHLTFKAQCWGIPGMTGYTLPIEVYKDKIVLRNNRVTTIDLNETYRVTKFPQGIRINIKDTNSLDFISGLSDEKLLQITL